MKVYMVILAVWLISSISYTAKGAVEGFVFDGMYFYPLSGSNPDGNAVELGRPYGELRESYQFPLLGGVLDVPAIVEHEGVPYTVERVSGIYDQTGLESLVLPESVNAVSNIWGCPFLKVIDFGGARYLSQICNLPMLEAMDFDLEGKVAIEPYNFEGLGLKEWDVPICISIIGNSVLRDWKQLKKLDLSRVKEIRINSVVNLPELETLTLPASFENNSSWMCFNGLPSLRKLVMSETYADDFCFVSCFEECAALVEIYCPSVTPVDVKRYVEGGEWPAMLARASMSEEPGCIEDNVVYEWDNIGNEAIDRDNCVVYVPHGCLEAYRTHPSWKVFKNIVEYDFASNAMIKRDADVVVTVSVNNGAIHVVPDCDFEVYDITGKSCASTGLSSGIYVVKTSPGEVVKVGVR